MNKIFGNIEDMLYCCVSGFHQYILQDPVHLSFASRSFCEMLGCVEEELISDGADLYLPLIHPEDRELYLGFIGTLSEKEQMLSVEYRIISKDGVVRYVKDTATSKRLDDGTLAAYSVLSDITKIKIENNDLHFLNETIPFGFIRYTCERNPKITYLNDRMMKIMRFPDIKDGEPDYTEMYRSNIYLAIPMEERRRFSRFLEKVDIQGSPVSGEITVIRCDGSKARLFGWVIKCINNEGKEEFQSVCMDITEKYQTLKANETERYLNALSEVYDKIFEYDFLNKTVKCLYGQKSEFFRHFQNISMDILEATVKWIRNSVTEEDRERVLSFFESYFQSRASDTDSQPPQIKYRAVSSSGAVRTYAGIFIKTDRHISLFCCRRATEEQETDSLRSENVSLRSMNENMQELVMRFTDGIVAFEVEDGHVKPLYASDNVCRFFGYTKEEWIHMAQQSHSIKTFVSKSGVDYEAFTELLKNGEADFEYIDVKTGTPHRIRAVCSNVVSGDSSRQYVMLYNVNENARKKPKAESNKSRIYIRTFGYFDVFVDEKPIAFRNEKSKELFALLVDRRGGYISSEEAISFLWEDESANSVTLARYRKVALRLKNILEEYGISDIVESINGRRRIVADKVRCDLYDYLSGAEEFSQLFKGSYLTNYSWGENTLGELLGEHI